MLDGNRLLLSGSFGDDVTDVNESPLRSSRDKIRQSTVKISCLAPPELLFTQHSPACAGREKQEERFMGSMGPASAKRLNSNSMAFISASTGIPTPRSRCTRVALSLSSPVLSFIAFALRWDIFPSLHHAAPSQVIYFSSGFYRCAL